MNGEMRSARISNEKARTFRAERHRSAGELVAVATKRRGLQQISARSAHARKPAFARSSTASRGSITGWARKDRYLDSDADASQVPSRELTHILVDPEGLLQLAGLVQRRRRRPPAVLGMLPIAPGQNNDGVDPHAR
jgi:hypothetical protein